MRESRQMSPRMIVLFLLVLGVIATVIGASTMMKQKKYVPVSAEITRIETEYDVGEEEWRYRTFVSYEVGGKRYNGELGYHEDSFEEDCEALTTGYAMSKNSIFP